MLTLALESSAKAASVALAHDGRLIAQYFQDSGLTHSITLMKMAQDILQNSDIKLSDLSNIAVSCGPGSFTGIRIGLAAAKGLALGAELPIRAVSTLRAAAIVFEDEGVILCPAMDARRGEVYNALFEVCGGTLTRLCDDRAIPASDVAAQAIAIKKPFLVMGDGAVLCYDALITAGVPAKLAPPATRIQCAYGVALAAIGAQNTPSGKVQPNYLRVSQAERLSKK